MEEFLAALLYGILEVFAEAFFELFFEAACSLIVRMIRNVFSGAKAESPVLAPAGYLVLGICSGIASVFLIPHPLVHPSRFHGISLLISPLVTGLIMSQVGAFLRRNGRTTVRIESFAYGFTFAFGIAIVRLVFLK